MVKKVWSNLVSWLKDGKTLNQKRRHIQAYYPGLYRALYEEDKHD